MCGVPLELFAVVAVLVCVAITESARNDDDWMMP